MKFPLGTWYNDELYTLPIGYIGYDVVIVWGIILID